LWENEEGNDLKVLIIIGLDFKGSLNYQRIADATQEKYWLNQRPPEGSEGWLFWLFDKEPDWGWGDYTFAIGTVEAGRHEITGRILASEDVEMTLIEAYDRLSEEVAEGEESA